MDAALPVITERKDIRTWKYLCSLQTSAAKNSKKNTEKLKRKLDDLKNSEGYVNPMIICKLLDLVDLYLSDQMHTIILELLEKCRITDCTPQLKAAEMMISMGLFDSAKIVLDRMTVITDTVTWEYLRGLIERNEGNMESALTHFKRCHSLDDRFLKVYHELDLCESEAGWKQRSMIASLMQGIDQPRTEEGTGRHWELYNAYWTWKNRDGGVAVDLLKRMVREGIESDVDMALARIYASQKNYQSAIDCFENAILDPKNMICALLEMAEMLISAGRADDALSVCERLLAQGISDRRFIEITVRAMALKKDRGGVVKYTDMLLCNDYADIRAYTVCATAMIDLTMHSEASGLISRMAAMDHDLPIVYYLESRNDYMVGRYNSSYSSAQKALRKDPDDREYLLNISKVLIAMMRLKKAQRYLDKLLDRSNTDRDALLLKKDIAKSKTPPEYEEAYRLCQVIIENYPGDTATIRDSAMVLEKLERYDEALNAYRAALAVRNDPVLFLSIINSLYGNGRLMDVVKMAAENENVYGGIIDLWVLKGNAEYALGTYPDAIVSYSKAIDIDSNDPTIWHSKGMAEERAHLYDEAEVSFDRAVLMDLDNSDYWISKSAVEEEKGDYAAAIDSLNRVISMHPENVYSLMRKASILVRLGKLSDAVIFVELASRIEPSDMSILIAKRDLYYHTGDTENTKNVCNSILKLDKTDIGTMKILARTYMSLNMLDDSVRMLTMANGADPDDLETLLLLREIYSVQGKTREEITMCKSALRIRPDDREIKSALAEAYIKNKQMDAAKALYDELHTTDPNDAEYSIKKAKMSDDGDALTVLMSTLASDPDNQKLLMEISGIMSATGRNDEAMVYINRAIAADMTALRPHLKKIEMIKASGNYEWMLSASQEAIYQTAERDPSLWTYLGYSQMMTGDTSNALISFDTAVKIGSVTKDIYLWRGMCYEAMGQFDTAASSYEDALAMDQYDIQVLMRMASVSLLTDRDAQAVKYLDRVLNKDPAYGDAILAKAGIYAAKGNSDVVKRTYDMCTAGGASEEVAREVTNLWGRMSAGDTIPMPVIPLGIRYASSSYAEKTADAAVPEIAEEASDGNDTICSDPEESISIPVEEAPVSEDTPVTDVPADDSVSEAVVKEDVSIPQDAVPEQTVGTDDSISVSVVSDDVELGFVVESSDDTSPDSYSMHQGECSVEELPAAAVCAAAVVAADVPEEKSIEEYAMDLMRFSYEHDDIVDDDDMMVAAGIPLGKKDAIYDYLTEIEDYGPITVGSAEFMTMERMSRDAVILGDVRDIEDEKLLPLTAAYFKTGVDDMDSAKRIVAYVYEALTCNIDDPGFSEIVRDAADEISYAGGPTDLFGIMKRFGMGVYSARAVKELASDGDSVVLHI